MVPYSTEITPTSEITPTPTFEGKFLHRLICLEKRPPGSDAFVSEEKVYQFLV